MAMLWPFTSLSNLQAEQLDIRTDTHKSPVSTCTALRIAVKFEVHHINKYCLQFYQRQSDSLLHRRETQL